MKSKFVLYYYLASVFMLSNGGLFNLVFGTLHLSVWRQLLFIIGMIIVINHSHSIKSFRINNFYRTSRNLFFIIFILSLITFVEYGFNVTRVAFSWWMYFSGIPFVLLPFVMKSNGWSDIKANRFFIYLGLFQTVGLILDYFSGGFFTQMFQSKESIEGGLLEAGRYCFTAEAPTTFGIYYCLCLVMTIRQLPNVTGFEKTFLLVLCCVYVIGAWFTGSRQIVVALLLVFATGSLNMVLSNASSRKYIVIGSVFILSAAPYVMSNLNKDETYEDRYSSEAIKDDTRYEKWNDGFKFCIGEFNIKRILVGEGISYVGMKVKPGEVYGYHFENSVWARMSDAGLVGLYILFLPLIVFFNYFKKRRLEDLLILSFLLSYVMTCYVSPNGQNQTSQMAVYIAIGFFLYNIEYQRKPNLSL